MSAKTTRVFVLGIGIALAIAGIGAWLIARDREPATPTVAFVSQSAGSMLWDVAHAGALAAAEKLRFHLYWNAPTSESDVAGQISLIDRVARGPYQGLILAPNHRLSLLAPLRRVIADGLPVVIVAASLDLPEARNLAYVVNDDDAMGAAAAAETARLMGGKGSVALVGITRYVPGVMERVRGAERVFAQQFPDIHVVSRSGGAYNPTRAQDASNSVLTSHPELKAVLSFTAGSTLGAHSALKARRLPAIQLVGCEQDTDLIPFVKNGEVSALIAENTYRMGNEAVGLIFSALSGARMKTRSVVPPLLITRQNLSSTDVTLFTGLLVTGPLFADSLDAGLAR